MSEEKTQFSQQLAYLNKGMLDSELTDRLGDVVQAVRETGKQGTITLTLKVAMLNKADENAVKITPNVKTSEPEAERAETIMWSNFDGELMRNDPEQQQFDLREVEKKTAEVRDVSADRKPVREVGGQD